MLSPSCWSTCYHRAIATPFTASCSSCQRWQTTPRTDWTKTGRRWVVAVFEGVCRLVNTARYNRRYLQSLSEIQQIPKKNCLWKKGNEEINDKPLQAILRYHLRSFRRDEIKITSSYGFFQAVLMRLAGNLLAFSPFYFHLTWRKLGIRNRSMWVWHWTACVYFSVDYRVMPPSWLTHSSPSKPCQWWLMVTWSVTAFHGSFSIPFFFSLWLRSQGTRWRPSTLPPSLAQTFYTSWRAPTRNSACRARHGPRKARLSSPCCRGWSPATKPFSWLVSDERFRPKVFDYSCCQKLFPPHVMLSSPFAI